MSVAFLAIGAGVGGLSEGESARALVIEVLRYSESARSVKEITLVGLNKYTCDCFNQAIDDVREQTPWNIMTSEAFKSQFN